MRLVILAVMLLSVMSFAALATPAAISDKRGTQDQPLIVKQVDSRWSEEEARRDALHSAERAEDVAYRKQFDADRRSMDRWTLRAAVATAFILVIQGVAFFVQAAEMRRSVEQMRAATTVAQQAAESAKVSAEAAVSANTLGRDALLAEHRPWIKFVATPVSLTLGQDGWHLKLSYELLNIGSAPALDVQFSAEMMAHVLAAWRDEEGPIDFAAMKAQATDVAAEIRRFSANVAEGAAASGIHGALLFPGDRITGTFSIYRADPAFADGLTRRGYAGQLLLLAGATYKSAVDRSWHYTSAPYGLYRVGGQPAGIRAVNGRFEAGPGSLAIQQHPLGDSYAS